MDANPPHGNNNGGNSSKDAKRQQFTNKQRMDMYAFCVLELEMHSNKVSIKKQQQAIQKVLSEQQREGQQANEQQDSSQQQREAQLIQTDSQLTLPQNQPQQLNPPPQQLPPQSLAASPSAFSTQISHQLQQQQLLVHQTNGEHSHQNNTDCNLSGSEGKTLLQLQQEVAMTRKCYSDYQKTQVLTSSMLRDVQGRFAKYYPDSAIPSRSTIKHVFEKCIAHGTVENIRTPRKATKIPQGDEIEYLLIHEPQLSLRQMAQKLNVSTGTVSRRCKALGLVPESVTIKHQQLATARRQKQIKLENQSKATTSASTGLNGNLNPEKLEEVIRFD